MSAVVTGFGCRPHGVDGHEQRGQRSKAARQGRRGKFGTRFSGPYGEFVGADGAARSLRWLRECCRMRNPTAGAGQPAACPPIRREDQCLVGWLRIFLRRLPSLGACTVIAGREPAARQAGSGLEPSRDHLIDQVERAVRLGGASADPGRQSKKPSALSRRGHDGRGSCLHVGHRKILRRRLPSRGHLGQSEDEHAGRGPMRHADMYPYPAVAPHSPV